MQFGAVTTWTIAFTGAAVAFAQPAGSQQVTGAERPVLYNEVIRIVAAGNFGRLREITDCGYKVVDGRVVPAPELHSLTTENVDSGRQFTWRMNGDTPYVQILVGTPGWIANSYPNRSTVQVMVNGVMVTGSCTYDPVTKTSHSCTPGTPIASPQIFALQFHKLTEACGTEVPHRAVDMGPAEIAAEPENAKARARMRARQQAELEATGVLKLAQ